MVACRENENALIITENLLANVRSSISPTKFFFVIVVVVVVVDWGRVTAEMTRSFWLQLTLLTRYNISLLAKLTVA